MIYNIVPLAFLIREVDRTKPLFLDTETVGLYGKVILVQAMQEDWEEALIVEYPDTNLLAELIENSWTVWHNASYDLSCLNVVPDKFDDTFLLAKLHFFKEEKFDLANVYGYALKYDPYKEAGIDKKVMQKTNWSGQLTELQYKYAAIDVYYMPELWKVLEATTDDTNYKLDIITVKHCQVMEKTGLPLLPLQAELNNTLLKLDELESKLPVNPRSSQQVKVYLDSPEGTGADILAQIISEGGERAEKAQMVKDARQLSKYKSTYLEKMAGHSRWYGHFSPRTRSGRLASSDNNLQNLPRAMKKFVGFIEADNKVLVSADFAQLELRTIAAITGDSLMCKLFIEGEDLHGYVAKMLFGDGYTKAQRQIAKTCNFALLYGSGAKTYAQILLKLTGIVITEQEAQTYKRKWLSIFKGVAAWQQRGIKQWRAGNYHWTPMGRRYKAKLLTDYLSIENQGAGAEVSKLAFTYIMNKLPEWAKITTFVHDSYVIECDNDEAKYKEVANILSDSLKESWEEYGKIVYTRGIPMPTAIGVALNWADADGMTDNCIYKLERKD